MHTITHVIDCVESPRRSDKPHRKLSLEVVVDGNAPGFCTWTCKDGETTVLEAEIDMDALETVVEIARTMELRLRRSGEW
jgi:hypothetical protein